MELDLSVVGRDFESPAFDYDWKHCATYALGVGSDDLDYVWEGSKTFKVLPTFAIVPTQPIVFRALAEIGADFRKLVHGEQIITLHGPIAPAGEMRSIGRVSAVHDKGKGAVVLIDTETFDPAGEKRFETRWSIFCRGQGGFGGERGVADLLPEPVAEAAPVVDTEMATAPNQALIYRLSGDFNPLHLDPALAIKAGFKGPILHGLATYGFAARAVITGICDGDPARLRRFRVRFSKEVYPGDVLRVRAVPSTTDGTYLIEVSVGDRVVLSNGVAEVG